MMLVMRDHQPFFALFEGSGGGNECASGRKGKIVDEFNRAKERLILGAVANQMMKSIVHLRVSYVIIAMNRYLRCPILVDLL